MLFILRLKQTQLSCLNIAIFLQIVPPPTHHFFIKNSNQAQYTFLRKIAKFLQMVSPFFYQKSNQKMPLCENRQFTPNRPPPPPHTHTHPIFLWKKSNLTKLPFLKIAFFPKDEYLGFLTVSGCVCGKSRCLGKTSGNSPTGGEHFRDIFRAAKNQETFASI